MRPLDIRNYKAGLREATKNRRKNINNDEKKITDTLIFNNVKKLYQYKSCNTVLVYVSTSIEVDTIEIIKAAWADNKKVAVPRCIPETRFMEFHYIDSFEQLTSGTFSVLEPNKDLPVVTDYANSLMIVPALIFDKFGYRLGYGKGYYDRYMSKYTGFTVGICYEADIKYRLHHGRFDRAVSLIVTENGIKKVIRKKELSYKN